jgi:hypothetical protein
MPLINLTTAGRTRAAKLPLRHLPATILPMAMMPPPCCKPSELLLRPSWAGAGVG